MRRRVSAVVVVASLLGIESIPVRANDAQPAGTAGIQGSDWAAVRSLSPESLVRIRDMAGRTTEGTLRQAGEDQIALLAKGAAVDITRPSVSRVDVAAGRQTRRDAFIGLLIGAAAGALQGAFLVETNKGAWAASLAAGWGAIGAAIGALHGSTQPKFTPVYRAP